MRAAFSILGLVIVAAIVLSLAKKQTAGWTSATPAGVTPPGASAAPAGGLPRPDAVKQQVQGSIDDAARRAAEAASAVP